MKFFPKYITVFILPLIILSCSGSKELGNGSYDDQAAQKSKTERLVVRDINVADLPKEFSALTDPRSGVWSVVFYDLDSKDILFEYNRNKNLLPASNLKLVTTAAAIKVLGPDYRFRTEFYTDGHIDRKLNLLMGNLYVKGTGDPSTAGNFLKDRSLKEFEPLIRELRLSRGIDYIEGKIIPLNRFRQEEAFGRGWDIDDLPVYYAAPVSPLTFHENLSKIVLKNENTEITPFYPFILKRDTIPDIKKAAFNRIIGTDSVIVRSTFKNTSSGFVTVNDPDKFYRINLKEHLEKNGVRIRDKTVLNNDTTKIHICTIFSDSLYRMIDKCSGESNNLYAEQIFRETAKVFSTDSALTDSLERIPLNYNNLLKINSDLYKTLFGIDNFTLSDGSGLSRMNFFSADKFIKVLSVMFDDPNFITYISSLPRPGTEGTLISKMTHPDLQNRLFAKTGSMTGVNALSGYLYTKNNRRIAFSVINNYFDLTRTRSNSIFEDILIYFANNY